MVDFWTSRNHQAQKWNHCTLLALFPCLHFINIQLSDLNIVLVRMVAHLNVVYMQAESPKIVIRVTKCPNLVKSKLTASVKPTKTRFYCSHSFHETGNLWQVNIFDIRFVKNNQMITFCWCSHKLDLNWGLKSHRQNVIMSHYWSL